MEYRQLFQNLKRELLQEWRSFYQLGGLLTFLLGVCYMIYFYTTERNNAQWVLMYWIVFLFLSFFAAARSYEKDNDIYRIYHHQLQHPLSLFLAKFIFLFVSLVVFGMLLKFIFMILMPVKLTNYFSWTIIVIAIAIGFSLLTSFTSFLASHGQNKQLLMIVISLPLCFPLIGMGFTTCLQVLNGESLSGMLKLFVPLLSIDLLAFALVILLLPLSWKN